MLCKLWDAVDWLFDDRRRWLGLLALGALFMTLFALILQYGFGVIPCQMCWWQRYIHWSLLGVSAAGVVAGARAERPAALLVVSLALGGLYIAVWQFLAQHGILHFPASCSGDGMPALSGAVDLLADLGKNRMVPCDKELFRLFGLSLAGWNMPVMTGYALFGAWGFWVAGRRG